MRPAVDLERWYRRLNKEFLEKERKENLKNVSIQAVFTGCKVNSTRLPPRRLSSKTGRR